VFGRDKIRTKHLLAAAGLPTAEYVVVESLPPPQWSHAWPAIVKPAGQDASVGIEQKSVVTSQAELDEQVRFVLEKYGAPVLIERFIPGREFHVNMVERFANPGVPVVLPVAEIAFEPTPGRWSIYSFIAKWDEYSDEYRTSPLKAPVELPEEEFSRLKTIAEQCYKLLMCRDYARIDVRMDAAGQFYVLEMNPNPYLNSLALVSGLMAVGGTHEELITELALAALARSEKPVSTDGITVPVGIVTGE
jgi:D-alanine-D-alanine ligase